MMADLQSFPGIACPVPPRLHTLTQAGSSIHRTRSQSPNKWKALMFTHAGYLNRQSPNNVLAPIWLYADDDTPVSYIVFHYSQAFERLRESSPGSSYGYFRSSRTKDTRSFASSVDTVCIGSKCAPAFPIKRTSLAQSDSVGCRTFLFARAFNRSDSVPVVSPFSTVMASNVRLDITADARGQFEARHREASAKTSAIESGTSFESSESGNGHQSIPR